MVGSRDAATANGACVPECTPGAVQCVGNALETCGADSTASPCSRRFPSGRTIGVESRCRPTLLERTFLRTPLNCTSGPNKAQSEGGAIAVDATGIYWTNGEGADRLRRHRGDGPALGGDLDDARVGSKCPVGDCDRRDERLLDDAWYLSQLQRHSDENGQTVTRRERALTSRRTLRQTKFGRRFHLERNGEIPNPVAARYSGSIPGASTPLLRRRGSTPGPFSQATQGCAIVREA